MKRFVLLSIQPKHIRDIEAGLKKFEFRKILPKFDDKTNKEILLYCSKPKMKIIGRIRLNEYYSAPFEDLMNIVGADDAYKRRIANYFGERKICHAIKIDEYVRYKYPLPLSELRLLMPGFVPGQSYRFLAENSAIVEKLLKLNKHI
ncbi:hypothetical protein [Vibrio aestuarianus]|uniref:hypothetical protein n=1 Tax=Vibrio aestuarianus TaxID=28171 RepID=UPI00249B17A3|nr:hypothetical protein [Vibrio aestuarianus]WDS54555.1 hypothetical protein MCL29_01720 [Vibrio aestuarianus]